MSQGKLRVFQFATGNVGSEMVGRIVDHPDLELVGLYCYSPDKVGRRRRRDRRVWLRSG